MSDPTAIPLYRCPSCFALYQVIKAQAGPDTVDLKIACQVCNWPLLAREEKSALKYFLLRKASRLDVQRARRGFLRAKPAARVKNASSPNGKNGEARARPFALFSARVGSVGADGLGFFRG
jgi:hypothetical protein